MKINIISIAYNLPESTAKLFQTAMLDSDQHDISFQLFLHSKKPETVAMCERLAKEFPCTYYPYGENRGLSNSWNEGILAAYEVADVVIIANDDVYFAAGDIDKLATKAEANRHNYMVSCAGFNLAHGKVIPSMGYSCFAMNPISLEKIGMFDEQIFPIYGEDQDHHRRAHLLGLVETNCADTNVWHAGSMAIKKDPILARQNMVTQTKNFQYLQVKWAQQGDDMNTGYKTPFNDKRLTCYIDPTMRHDPYPDYRRLDRGIVRF